MKRFGYPSDVSDEEWDFMVPYLCLLNEDVPQRKHSLREVFNGLRYLIRSGCAWRYLPNDLPNDLPPWEIVYQQTQRWLRAGVFETMANDLRQVIRQLGGREPAPSAAIVDSRTLCSTCESGPRAGYDGAKKRSGSKVHIAVDTLGHLLALSVTPADEGDRSQVSALCQQVQEVTGDSVQLVWVDQGYTGQNAAQQAAGEGIELHVIKLEEAKRGFVLLPRRWVVERSFAWANRFRRLVKDYERLPETLKGLHFLAFASLMVKNLVNLILSSLHPLKSVPPSRTTSRDTQQDFSAADGAGESVCFMISRISRSLQRKNTEKTRRRENPLNLRCNSSVHFIGGEFQFFRG